MIEVLLVDDHAIFRSGLTRLLGDEADLRVVGEASNGNEALAFVRSRPCSVILLDINMSGRNGLDILASIHAERPSQPVLMLSMYPENQYAVVALRAGAAGYVAKDAEPEELLDAIRKVARGGRHLSSRVAGDVCLQLGNAAARVPHETLSVRERQIMSLIVKGLALTEIGAQLCLSVKTVSTYRTRILAKLSLGSNAELVRYALRHHLLD